jgi:hypothetical protein
MQRNVPGNRLTDMAAENEFFDITSAPKSLSTDQAGRQKRYFISMMIRTLCFILTVILPSPFRWIALFGAVVLPYFAVVIANAGRETFTAGAHVKNKNPLSLD